MKFNYTHQKGIAMAIASFLAVSLIVSCQKDRPVSPNDINSANVSITQPLASTSYVTSGPVVAKSNTTYSGLLIDLGNSSSNGFTLNGVTNVHITNCKIINSKSFAINLYNCTNVTIDNTYISNVGFGVYVQASQTVKINNNQFSNINGISTTVLGHAVQFNGVSGSGNQINSNRIENISGVALHPNDMINLYSSSGLKGDSIQVIGNWIRGGQMSFWPTSTSGACGISAGVGGGSYQVVRSNILVNPGYIGIQALGGNHLKLDHNLIYSSATPVSGAGMVWGNYSGTTTSDVIYAYNQVKFYNAQGKEFDYNANGTGVTLINNTWGANISASILPTTIINGTTTSAPSTPATPTNPSTSYTASGPIILKSNTTISGLSIDLGNKSTIGITGTNISNVHITNCRIVNTTYFAAFLYNCKNITIDNCYFSNVGMGVYSNGNSQTIKVNNNQFLNINGINTSALGHAVQFESVSGSGNQINNNRIENIAGVALHPHDIINLYNCNGLAGDSIQVIGNWIRGGQRSFWPTSTSGAAGIVLGDGGGSYQVARNNILVDPGVVGMQAQGGSSIKMEHNTIYSDVTPVSGAGMSWGNYSGQSSWNVTYSYNKVKFFNNKGNEYDYNANNTGITLISNTWAASISASILPTTIITMK